MADRLSLLREPPRRILDWGEPLGQAEAALRSACPQARLLALDVEGQPLRPGRNRWWQRLRPASADDLTPTPGDMLWSNLLLHWVDDLPALLARWHERLPTNGMLMFSAFGPDTLAGLRRIWAAQGWGAACSTWMDMHDLGDALVQAGFRDPVMDMEQLTLTWESPEALLAELRTLGRNTAPQRFAGLRTPRWHEAMRQGLAEGLRGSQTPDGRLQLRFEIVYGHALRAAPRVPVAAETQVSVDTLRSMARLHRRSP